MPRIMVWNINALAPTVKNFVLKYGSIRGFFDSFRADIVCFQETKLIEEKLTKELACVDGYESFWAISQNKKGYSGVATYAREEWSPVSVEVDSLGTLDTELNGEGRVIVSDHGSFVLLNVYVPNAGQRKDGISARADLKIRFLHALKSKCDTLREEGRQVILVGDLNIAASTKDVHPCFNWSKMYHPEEMEVMRSILREYTDVWRLQNPDATEIFTVWDEKTSARAWNKGVRIDYVLVSAGLLPHMGPCKVLGDLPPKWSDHAALLVDIINQEQPPAHEPVALSSRRMKRFDTRAQPSIASMFARRKPAANAPLPVKSKVAANQMANPAPEEVSNASAAHAAAEMGPQISEAEVRREDSRASTLKNRLPSAMSAEGDGHPQDARSQLLASVATSSAGIAPASKHQMIDSEGKSESSCRPDRNSAESPVLPRNAESAVEPMGAKAGAIATRDGDALMLADAAPVLDLSNSPSPESTVFGRQQQKSGQKVRNESLGKAASGQGRLKRKEISEREKDQPGIRAFFLKVAKKG